MRVVVVVGTIHKLKGGFSENEHRKKVSRKGRLRSPETKEIVFPGKMEGSLGKYNISTLSWDSKLYTNVLEHS